MHPQGGKLAVSFYNTTALQVYDARTLNRLYAVDTNGINSVGLFTVAWSTDGARLYAAGTGANSLAPLVIWQNEGWGVRSQAPLTQNTIMQASTMRRLRRSGNG